MAGHIHIHRSSEKLPRFACVHKTEDVCIHVSPRFICEDPRPHGQACLIDHGGRGCRSEHAFRLRSSAVLLRRSPLLCDRRTFRITLRMRRTPRNVCRSRDPIRPRTKWRQLAATRTSRATEQSPRLSSLR